MYFLKNNLIKIFVLVVVILFLPLFSYSATPDHIDISSSGNIVDQPTTITVTTHHSIAPFTSWNVTVTHFGDSSPQASGNCIMTTPAQTSCDVVFNHTYSNTGTFVFTVNICDPLRPGDPCMSSSANINIGTACNCTYSFNVAIYIKGHFGQRSFIPNHSTVNYDFYWEHRKIFVTCLTNEKSGYCLFNG